MKPLAMTSQKGEFHGQHKMEIQNNIKNVHMAATSKTFQLTGNRSTATFLTQQHVNVDATYAFLAKIHSGVSLT
jgi:hypothetical protein